MPGRKPYGGMGDHYHHTVLRQDILDELTFTLRLDANDIGFAVETGIVDP